MCLSARKHRGLFIIMHRYRSHTCGVLREADIGKEVRLSGWCHRKRDHGGLLFVDLRDHYGITQVVCPESVATAAGLRQLGVESVVTVTGAVSERSAGSLNAALATGEVEVTAATVAVLSAAHRLPFA